MEQGGASLVPSPSSSYHRLQYESPLEAQNSMKLQQLLQHQNSEASSVTTGMQLYFGIGHISIVVTLMRGGG